MAFNKKIIILVIIALVLAITAISLRVMDSDEVPTSQDGNQIPAGTGKVGVTIFPTNVEDKLADNSGGNQE